jgi:ankyrin repeat protein
MACQSFTKQLCVTASTSPTWSFNSARQTLKAKAESGLKVMHFAAIGGNSAVLPRLLKAGANMNAQDGKGHTPLYYSICHGNDDTVNLLLEYGA